jgi:hypothetical protein
LGNSGFFGFHSVAALNERGLSYASKGDYDRAIGDYTEAIRLDRKSVLSFSWRGSAYEKKGELDTRMAEGSGGLGHIVTPADWLARIAHHSSRVAATAGARMTVGRAISPECSTEERHDPKHVGEGQLARCGGFLPHLLVCAASRSLGAAGTRPFSTVSAHRAIA